ncbi:MAG: 16S rRNA (cytosine(1402)-N(4))-methyltransferase RsmH [Anaerolineales bacterium]
MNAPHLSVLYKDIIHALSPRAGGRYIDGTLGAGGHAAGILEVSAPDGELLGLDLDPQALAIARERLSGFGERAHIVQASYLEMAEQASRLGWEQVDGIVLDLGLSSMQLDTAERGFSFLQDGPLDMRFDPTLGSSAADLLNSLDEGELADILFRYGEERLSRRIARAIVHNRPLASTRQLADLVLKTIGKRERIHPATRTFQALRIAVNGELDAVESVLPMAVEMLKQGGRLAVISFHSLEDRIVKTYFRHEGRDCICPPQQPVCTCAHRAQITEINRKPIEANAEEVVLNSRARSAKLRIVEKK